MQASFILDKSPPFRCSHNNILKMHEFFNLSSSNCNIAHILRADIRRCPQQPTGNGGKSYYSNYIIKRMGYFRICDENNSGYRITKIMGSCFLTNLEIKFILYKLNVSIKYESVIPYENFVPIYLNLILAHWFWGLEFSQRLPLCVS